MRHRRAAVLGTLALAIAVGLPSAASPAMPPAWVLGDSAILTIDVLPLTAQVWLNGAPLGTAHDLLARAIPIVPGYHVLEVTAPGYLSSRVDVSAAPDWPTRVWLQLVPDRRR